MILYLMPLLQCRFLENLPIYGNISMEIGTLGKFPGINGNMTRGGGRQVKIEHILNSHGSQWAGVRAS
jgi:hypothetical protein